MRGSKMLGALVLVIQLGSVALLAVTTFTLISVIQSSIMALETGIEAELDESSGEVTLSLDAMPSNDGYLEADLVMSLGAIDENGEYIAIDSKSLTLDSGESEPVELEVISSLSELEPYLKGEKEGFLEVRVHVRTLYNLVGFTNTIRIRGGQQ